MHLNIAHLSGSARLSQVLGVVNVNIKSIIAWPYRLSSHKFLAWYKSLWLRELETVIRNEYGHLGSGWMWPQTCHCKNGWNWVRLGGDSWNLFLWFWKGSSDVVVEINMVQGVSGRKESISWTSDPKTLTDEWDMGVANFYITPKKSPPKWCLL